MNELELTMIRRESRGIAGWLCSGSGIRALGAALLSAMLVISATANAQTISTFAGGVLASGVDRLETALYAPSDVKVDPSGNILIADTGRHRIVRIDPSTGLARTVAGSALSGSAGDGAHVRLARISPRSLAIAPDGTIYFSEVDHHRIRKIDAFGNVSAVAGTGSAGYSGDHGQATSAMLKSPEGIALDGAGNLFIADTGNGRVRRVDGGTGTITTFAGQTLNTNLGDGEHALLAYLPSPRDVAFDVHGHLYVASVGRVRRIDGLTGVISTFAGGGSGGNGSPAIGASLGDRLNIAFDLNGDLLISSRYDMTVQKVSVVTGIIDAFAGMEAEIGYTGDGGAATSARMSMPLGMAVTTTGDVLIADSGNSRIRKVSGSSGVITTHVGAGISGTSGDGGAALAARVAPGSMAFDAGGNLFFSTGSSIRRVDGVRGTLTVASTQISGSLRGMPDGSLLVASGSRLHKLNVSTGVVTAYAGTGQSGFSGDGGEAIAATFNGIGDVAIDAAGNVYVLDKGNRRVRRIDTVSGIVTTIAGNGVDAYSGDGGPATQASFRDPTGIAVDGGGHVFVADALAHVVRRISSENGTIATVAGSGSAAFSGNGGLATSAYLKSPTSVAVDASGNLYIGDTGNNHVRRVDASTGIITTLAGGTWIGVPSVAAAGYTGDGGPALGAHLHWPGSMTFGPDGSLYIADGQNSRIRIVTFGPDRGTQAVDFGALESRRLDQSPLNLGALASATSGLGVHFGSPTPEVCSVSGVTLSLHRVGTCVVHAIQPGNASFFPAIPEARRFEVTAPIASFDSDDDGIPDVIETIEGTDPYLRDNDIFASARLFAMQQYRDFLGREGDAAGIEGWTNALTVGPPASYWTRPMVIDAFLSSAEFEGTVGRVARLYFATFMRVPDYDGLIHNAGLLRGQVNEWLALRGIADYFVASPEFQATYGSLDNTAFVTLLYSNVLGRAPDAGGLAGWVAALDGGMTRGEVLLGFSESPEYQAAIANEVFVTMMYAGMLRRTPEAGGFSSWVAWLDAGSGSRELVIDGFFQSAEYRARFLP